MQKILIVTNEKETLARLYDGDKVTKSASAKCSPTDTFDFAVGAKLVFDRLMQDKPEAQQYREVERVAKVGELIKIVNPINSFGDYHKGDIMTVCKSTEVSVHTNECVSNPTSVRTIWHREYVVLEPITDKPTEPIKPAVDYSTWRVVKRDPVVGDKVRIINHRGFHWNANGKMDKWMGKIMTIRNANLGRYRMIEDANENEHGWSWNDSDIAEILEPCPAFKVGDRVRIKHTKDCPNANPVRMWDKYAGREATISSLETDNTCHLSGLGHDVFWWTLDALDPCPEHMVRVFSKTAYNAFIDAIDQHEVIDGRIGGKPCNPDWTSLVPESEVRK